MQRKLVQKIDGVIAVHEFHIWQLAGDRIIASAHIRCRNLTDYVQIAEKVKELFHNEGIHSTTIQPEFSEVSYLLMSGPHIMQLLNAVSKENGGCIPNQICFGPCMAVI